MTAAVSIDRIKMAVAAEFDVPVRNMESERRHRSIVWPRQVAMYIACTITPQSTVVIGRQFGKRDHTTVLHALNKVAAARDDDSDLDQRIRRLEHRLEQGLDLPAPTVPLSDELQLAFLTGPLFDWLHDPVRPRPTLSQLQAA